VAVLYVSVLCFIGLSSSTDISLSLRV